MSRLFIVGLLLSLSIGCTGGGGDGSMGPILGGTGGGGGDCTYPTASGVLRTGETMPDFSWSSAFRDGSTQITFDLQEFHCGAAYEDYSSMVLVVGEGWCGACPSYITWVDSISEQLSANGSLIVYLEGQTASYEPASSAQANEFINNLIGSGRGIRIGDADNSTPSGVDSQVGAVPAGFFIRKSDMMIIAESDAGLGRLPYEMLSGDPDYDWIGDIGGTVTPNCGPADEEPGEPNDTPAEATRVTAGMTVSGGICDGNSDHYRIEHTGDWRFNLTFSHAVGDLDMYIVNEDGSRGLGSATIDDNESINWNGPATIVVFGNGASTAPYTAELVAL